MSKGFKNYFSVMYNEWRLGPMFSRQYLTLTGWQSGETVNLISDRNDMEPHSLVWVGRAFRRGMGVGFLDLMKRGSSKQVCFVLKVLFSVRGSFYLFIFVFRFLRAVKANPDILTHLFIYLFIYLFIFHYS